MELEGVELDRVVRKALQISVKTVGRAVPEGELTRLREENDTLREEFQKEIYEIGERNHRLETENSALKSEVDHLRSELEDAQLKISAWKAKADRRADKIAELEREMEMRMEYSDEECNAKAEAAHQEWAYNELCEEVDQLRLRNTELREDLRTASGNAKKYADMTLKLEAENPMLRAEVDHLRSELEDAQLKISAWKAKADRRADKISELEAEVERLRNEIKLWEMFGGEKSADAATREKYLWRHVPGVTCEQPGKMTIEENHGD